MSQVALVRCDDYELDRVRTAVRRCVELVGGMKPFVQPGQRVLVKPNLLIGRAPERIRHHLEIRGLGILYIPDLFGVDRVREAIALDLVVRLEHWQDGAEYDRLGLDRGHEEIHGVKITALRLPARPGGSMATIVEVAAREHRRREAGDNAIERLDQRVRRDMGSR